MESQHKKPDTKLQENMAKAWLEFARSIPVESERELAKAVVKIRGENARKRLIVRTKLLPVVIIFALLSAIQSALYAIPALRNGDTGVVTLLFTVNMAVQLITAAYFLIARDPEFAEQVLSLLFVFNGLALFMGFAWLGSVPLTVAMLTLLYITSKRMEQLKYGGD